MRLIDADALKVRSLRVGTIKEPRVYFRGVGTREIDKAPTIEAIPLDIHIAKIERLEKALDKACRKLYSYDLATDFIVYWDAETWKEWCLKDD